MRLNRRKFCECGCGTVIKSDRKFVRGHALKGKKFSEEHRRKMSLALKGRISPNKGKHHSEETKRKISLAARNMSAETKRKMSLAGKGRIFSEEHKRKMSLSAQNMSEETKMKMSLSRCGPFSSNWKGGISFEPYCCIFSIQEFKDIILERDNYRCQNPDCNGISKRRCIHHIDYDKKNCKLNNLITLCASCNTRANTNRDEWQKFYQEKVGSK